MVTTTRSVTFGRGQGRDRPVPYRQIAETTRQGIWTVDADGVTTFVNGRAADMVGVPAAELVGRPAARCALFGSPEPAVAAATDVLAGALGHQELHARRADGTDVWLEVATSPLLDDDGAFAGGLATITDVSGRFRGELEVADHETWLRAIVQHAFDVVAAVTPDGIITFVTPAAERLFNRDTARLEGARLFDLIYTDDQERARRTLARAVSEPGRSVPIDLRVVRDDGSFRWVEAVATSLLDEPAVRRVIVHGRDVTGNRLATARLNYVAMHDPLTGLPNDALVRDRLTHALARCARSGGLVAVCFVGLDRFTLVNDIHGHAAGDRILTEVGPRLRACLRAGDTVGRFGGDSYTLVLESVASAAEAYHFAQRVLAEAFATPFDVDGSTHLSASIGIAVGTQGSTVDRLLSNADATMHAAKRKGGGRVEIYEHGLRAAAAARMNLETGLRRAIDEDQFAVAYQPVVSVADGNVVGAEALVRWMHPDHGIISPLTFIPLAEETGLIEPIGALVFERACAQLHHVQLAEPALAFAMSVNVSPVQLGGHRTAEFLHTVERLGVDPTSLVLEITESHLVHQGVMASLVWLRSHGIKVAVDDFGTGYSSLSCLKQLPVDIVKIDRSFVAGLGTGLHDTAIVHAIISMAEALGLTVVAEGVETGQQLETLASLGCSLYQGFLFGPPVIPAVGESLLACLAGAPASGNISRMATASPA